jgi:hypothetical protein
MNMRTIQEHSLELFIREEASRHFGGRYGAGLQALVLTGSMARNEATTVEVDGVRRVLGDAEFLLIFRDSVAWLPDDFELTADCARIEAALRDLGIACAIGANRAYPDYLRRMKPHIFGYELKTCGQVLLGDPDILSLMPSFSAKDIPCEDGWQLLMNRLIELLKPAAQAPSGTGSLPRDLHYRTVKLYLDMAASLLLFSGSFEAGYRGRCERLREIAALADQSSDLPDGAGKHWPFSPDKFARRVAEATDYKLSGQTGDRGREWEYLRDALAYAHALWRWELARLTGRGERRLSHADDIDEQLFARWARCEPVQARLRGWASQLRKPGVRRDLLRRPSWVLGAWKASPRYCVYSAAARLIFRVPELLSGRASEPDSVWNAIARRLPLRAATTECATAWRQLARSIARNYEELLIGTRA